MKALSQSLALAGLTVLSLGLSSAHAAPVPTFKEALKSPAPAVEWQMGSTTPEGSSPQCADGKKGKGDKHLRHKHKLHDRCGVFKQLNLTDAQKQQLKAKREAFKARMTASGKTWHTLTQEERMANRDAMKRDLAMVLTPSQFAQFETLMQQCREKRPGRPGSTPPSGN